MAILQVNHLAKTFSNSTIVLKDISFEAKDNSLYLKNDTNSNS